MNQAAIAHLDMFMTGEATPAFADCAAGRAAVRIAYLAEGIEAIAGDDVAAAVDVGHGGAEVVLQLEVQRLRAAVALAPEQDGCATGRVNKETVDFIAGLIEVFVALKERYIAGVNVDDGAVDVALADAVVIGVVRPADAVDKIRQGNFVLDKRRQILRGVGKDAIDDDAV